MSVSIEIVPNLGSSGAIKAPVFPCILGRDFSGTVAALGPGVTDLKVGDAVFIPMAPPGKVEPA